jgi:hypothetical protein
MWPRGRPAPSIIALPIDLIFLFERRFAAAGPPSGGTEQPFEIVYFRGERGEQLGGHIRNAHGETGRDPARLSATIRRARLIRPSTCPEMSEEGAANEGQQNRIRVFFLQAPFGFEYLFLRNQTILLEDE